MKTIIIVLTIALVAIAAVSAKPRLAQLPQSCVPGHVTSDYCNSCTCISDGTGYLCTTNECPAPRRTCVPGKSFRNYCNTCNCPLNGMRDEASCTLMGCAEGAWNEDGTMTDPSMNYKINDDEGCEVGTTKIVNCDSCMCDGDYWSCVRGGCI